MLIGFHCERCKKEKGIIKFTFLSTICKDCKYEIEDLIKETYKIVLNKKYEEKKCNCPCHSDEGMCIYCYNKNCK